MRLLAIACLSVVLLPGCGDRPLPREKDFPAAKPDSDLFMLLGKYNARMRAEQGGVLRLYIVGEDEMKIATIDAVDITGHLQAEDETEGIRITLKPDPQPGDPKGQASEFKGEIPEAFRGKPLLASLSLTVQGERYRAAFRSTPRSRNHEHEWMAAKGPRGDGLKQLYATPGGKYTAEDIKANGNRPAGVKFRGMMARHDMKPKPGDKLCPITETKANPQFPWIVGGKKYEFCCPPCIDEFVQLAKEKPEEIKPPEEYVKK